MDAVNPKSRLGMQPGFLPALLISAVGLLCYSNTFGCPFQFDEAWYILKNPFITAGAPIESMKYNADLHKALHHRYLGFLTFLLNYRLHGAAVAGYHIINVTIHILTASLVYYCTIFISRTPFLEKAIPDQRAKKIALFSAVLFIAHPLQTEAVTYIHQRIASLAAFFYLLSIFFYLRCRLNSGGSSGICYTASLVSAVLAMKTKQNTFSLPAAIVAIEFFFFSSGFRSRMCRFLPFAATLLIIPLTFFISLNRSWELSTKSIEGLSRTTYLLTEFRVMLTYLRLFFLPINQNLDYDYPMFDTLLNYQTAAAAAAFFLLIALGAYLFFLSKKDAGVRIVSFGIAWFFITLSVESSFIPIVSVIDEYRMYLPSAGLCMALSYLLFRISDSLAAAHPGLKTKTYFALVCLPILFSAATFHRNGVWRDGVSLWTDVVSKSPHKVRAHYNLGVAYHLQGRLPESVSEFREALRIDPDDIFAHNNLGAYYAGMGMTDEAIGQYQEVIRVCPLDDDALFNLGMIYLEMGRLDEAMRKISAAVSINPYFAEAYSGMGDVYTALGRYDDALQNYHTAAKLKPDISYLDLRMEKAVDLKMRQMNNR